MTSRAEAIEAAAHAVLGLYRGGGIVPEHVTILREALALPPDAECTKPGPTNLVHTDVHASVVSERDTLLQQRDEYLRQVDKLHAGINYLRGQYLGNAAEARRQAARAWFGRRWFVLAAEALEDTAKHLADVLERSTRR